MICGAQRIPWGAGGRCDDGGVVGVVMVAAVDRQSLAGVATAAVASGGRGVGVLLQQKKSQLNRGGAQGRDKGNGTGGRG